MSLLSRDLHQSIRRALAIASEQCSGHATTEHLLIALADDPDAAPVMRACNVDFEELRVSIYAFLFRTNQGTTLRQPRVHPNASFQRVVGRAVRHVRSMRQDAATGAHVLVQVFGDPAARFLREQGMARYDAVVYVCHGIVKQTETATSAAGGGDTSFKFNSQRDGDTDSLRYELRLLNDMYTPMKFVVQLLQEVLSITPDQAIDIMLSTHRNGTGSCGIYPPAEARNLAQRIMEKAREHQHPLRCVAVPYQHLKKRPAIVNWIKYCDQYVWNAFWQGAAGGGR